MSDTSPTPDPSGAWISIHRLPSWSGYFRRITLRLNGEITGKLKNHDTLQLRVAPGEHQLQVTMDFAKDAVTFTAEAGQNLRFECRMRGRWDIEIRQVAETPAQDQG